ncbi:MAG: leucine-rich repeat domain-containing protein [Candidatus Lokiarchaeota archaeon]|nr:leucine-rich repeat domain-containing protein [Candidatus Lokiarchaeota archaeon]
MGDYNLLNLPESIGYLTSLEELYLENNELKFIPESIGNLTSLKWLYLNNNQLVDLPEVLVNLTSLQTLGLKDNPLLKNLNSITKSVMENLERNEIKIIT